MSEWTVLTLKHSIEKCNKYYYSNELSAYGHSIVQFIIMVWCTLLYTSTFYLRKLHYGGLSKTWKLASASV